MLLGSHPGNHGHIPVGEISPCFLPSLYGLGALDFLGNFWERHKIQAQPHSSGRGLPACCTRPFPVGRSWRPCQESSHRVHAWALCCPAGLCPAVPAPPCPRDGFVVGSEMRAQDLPSHSSFSRWFWLLGPLELDCGLGFLCLQRHRGASSLFNSTACISVLLWSGSGSVLLLCSASRRLLGPLTGPITALRSLPHFLAHPVPFSPQPQVSSVSRSPGPSLDPGPGLASGVSLRPGHSAGSWTLADASVGEPQSPPSAPAS